LHRVWAWPSRSAFVILSISQLRQFDVETNQVILNQEKEFEKLSDLFKSGMREEDRFRR